ncbi:Hypothetical predicted protein, partial [Mytilus galloprovincialis]
VGALAACFAIFIILVVVAIAVVSVLFYRRKYGSLRDRWDTLRPNSSVAYKRYTDDEGIKMGTVTGCINDSRLQGTLTIADYRPITGYIYDSRLQGALTIADYRMH